MRKSTGKGRRGRKREDYEGHQATLRSDKRVHCLDFGDGFCGCVLMSNCSNSASYNMSIVSQKNCKKTFAPLTIVSKENIRSTCSYATKES